MSGEFKSKNEIIAERNLQGSWCWDSSFVFQCITDLSCVAVGAAALCLGIFLAPILPFPVGDVLDCLFPLPVGPNTLIVEGVALMAFGTGAIAYHTAMATYGFFSGKYSQHITNAPEPEFTHVETYGN